ncbi:MAG: diguanylate cyclase [Pseudomonadota bacterium]
MFDRVSSSRKPLAILAGGYIAKVVAIAAFGYFASTQMYQLHEITEQLYEHPFAVSNAAAELKSDAAQIRIRMLQIAMAKTPGEIDEYAREVESANLDAKQRLAMIKQGFLGDMRQVEEIEQAMQTWETLRTGILLDARNGHPAEARSLVLGPGTALYGRIQERLVYVSTYAHRRAEAFVREANYKADFAANNLLWLTGMIVAMVVLGAVYVFGLFYRHSSTLESEAHTDSLTGLLNRHQFHVLAEHEFRRIERYGGELSVLVLDIDYFKQINDRYGHAAGDVVLRACSDIMRRHVRSSDLICRWGGEEFVVLLPQMDMDGAYEIARRISQYTAAAPVETDGGKIAYTLSGGVAEYNGQADISDLIDLADIALYRAKKGGRNRVAVFTPGLNMPEADSSPDSEQSV